MVHLATLRKLLGAALLAGIATHAAAANYPDHAMVLVVPYPPGASTDSLARITAVELGKELGQTIVVENRPGGETTIGTLAVKRAPADGYTIMLQSGGFMTATYALKNPGYALSDFTPVSPLIKTPFVLTIPSSIPANTIDEYFAYARKNQASMNHGTLGAGANIYRIMGDSTSSAGGFKWTDVAYKGGAEAVQALLSGQIQAYFTTVSLAVTQQKQPALKLLGITDTKRSAYLPNVPTFAEAGYPNVLGSSLYGVYVRAETPEPIKKTLEAAMRKVMASEAMKASIASLSLDPYPGSLEDFTKELYESSDQFRKNAMRLGLERK